MNHEDVIGRIHYTRVRLEKAAPHEGRSGPVMLLGVYLIFFAVFWYLLVAPPFKVGPAPRPSGAAATSAPLAASPQHRIVGNEATLGQLSAVTRPSSGATVVSGWNHSTTAAVH